MTESLKEASISQPDRNELENSVDGLKNRMLSQKKRQRS